MKLILWGLGGSVGILIVMVTLAIFVLNFRGEEGLPSEAVEFRTTEQQVERGRYLAVVGNCASCHTTRGGSPYSGGVVIETPFGEVLSSNITPHRLNGIGAWTSANFWRAMHHGRSKDGRLLYPAFPYPSFSKITREDSDALYAFLQTSVPESERPNEAHRLQFPYSTQAALAVWRAISFRPGDAFAAVRVDKSAEWNRGAYILDGLGHCIACHGVRDRLGAINRSAGLSGGNVRIDNWYAPSLTATSEAGVSDWEVAEIVELFQTGQARQRSVAGPMADVVSRSTQHWSDADLRAMASYLKDLPVLSQSRPTPGRVAATQSDAASSQRGEKIYDQRCAYCHGVAGEGEPGKFPSLAGNRSVLMATPTNLIQIVRQGEFQPTTVRNPRPYGMPPFGQVLDDSEILDVLTFVRSSWGNAARAVTSADMLQK